MQAAAPSPKCLLGSWRHFLVESPADALGPQSPSSLVETRQDSPRSAVVDVRGEKDDRDGLAEDSSGSPRLRQGIRMTG